MTLLIDDRRSSTSHSCEVESTVHAVDWRGQTVSAPLGVAGLYPAHLLADETTPGAPLRCTAEHATWWLAHVRPRQEKALASDLLALAVPHYLPQVPRKSLARRQTRYVQIPLFPGYIFVCGTERNRLATLKTNRVVSICSVPDGEALRKQLKSFAALIAAGAPLVRESRLEPGERVRIKTGPFRDFEGVIFDRQGKTKLLVAIDFLGQGASFGIDDCGVEAV